MSISLFSCKNELDINAEPKETAVVYGVIDPNSNAQYLRVNKTYLVKSNAVDAAKNGQLMTNVANIKVTLYTLEKGDKKDMYLFTLDSTFIKNPGLFYTEPNIIFKANTNNPKITFTENTDFLVVIENTQTNYKAQAKTHAVLESSFGRNNPNSFNTLLSPKAYTLNLFNAMSGTYSNLSVEFKPGKNSRIVFPYVRFYWHEKTNNQISAAKFLDYPFPYQRIDGSNEQQDIKLAWSCEEFYRYLGERIQKTNSIKRFVDSVSIVIEAGNDDFDTFYSVSNTSTNTTLEKPSFTNVSNGLGIVSAKCTNITKHKNYYNYPSDVRPFYLDPATNSISAGGLTAASLKELATGKYTSQLRFAYFTTTQATPIDTVFAP